MFSKDKTEEEEDNDELKSIGVTKKNPSKNPAYAQKKKKFIDRQRDPKTLVDLKSPLFPNGIPYLKEINDDIKRCNYL